MGKTLLILLALLCSGLKAAADDWMGHLPDSLRVCELSIPGAHDAATGNGFSGLTAPLGKVFARTQDLDLAAQWAAGARAFDLRPATRKGYLSICHGFVKTKLRLAEALCLLRDSLRAHPTEFAIVHLRHEVEGDKVKDEGAYEALLLELLGQEGLKDFMADFRPGLTVGEMRGKILLLSRDRYAHRPVGGFLQGWCGRIDWEAQTRGRIIGPDGDASPSESAALYVQDFSDTRAEGAIAQKVAAIRQLLDFSTVRTIGNQGDFVWVFNFASAYCRGRIASTSNGYRENASHTNAAIIDYLLTHDAGPAGIVFMDYLGVEKSHRHLTHGKELVRQLIDSNFRYLERKRESSSVKP